MMEFRSAIAELAALLEVAATALDELVTSQPPSATLKQDLQEVREIAQRLRAIGKRSGDGIRDEDG